MTALDRKTSLMISSMLLGILVWLHGMVSPFNSIAKNAIESFFLLNLLMVFIVSPYTPSVVVVSILTSVATLELVCIALYNGFGSYWNIFLYKIARLVFIQKAVQLYKDFRKKSTKEVEQVELINVVPEVDFNYKEFQEPLLAIRCEK